MENPRVSAPPAVAVAPQQLHGAGRLHGGPGVLRRQRRGAVHGVEAPEAGAEGGAPEPVLGDTLGDIYVYLYINKYIYIYICKYIHHLYCKYIYIYLYLSIYIYIHILIYHLYCKYMYIYHMYKHLIILISTKLKALLAGIDQNDEVVGF